MDKLYALEKIEVRRNGVCSVEGQGEIAEEVVLGE